MKLICSIVLLIYQFTCLAQVDFNVLLDSVINRTKQTSMYSSQINWDSLSKEVHLKAANVQSIQDLKPAFTILLNGLGDVHARIINAQDYSTIAYFTDYDKLNHPDKRAREDEIWKIVNDTSLKFESRLLADRIGYLRIVGIPPNIDIAKEAEKIRNALIHLSNLNVEKWIIDLQYNGGGNMHPMVSGIAPLIGEGLVGSLSDLNGKKQFDWEIKNGNFIYYGYQALNLPYEPKFKNIPQVAVLTSKWTVSSGELLATCFKGRPNTRFFGEMTGSLTTNNNWEIVQDQVIVNISTGIYCDRNGIIYKYNIPVDVEIPFKVYDSLEQDDCIQKAILWLMAR